jgi:hypothetical protein
MKLPYKCLMHSLYSAAGNTDPTAVSSPLQAYVHMTNPSGNPKLFVIVA